MKNRIIKFRAFQDNEMIFSRPHSNYELAKFFSLLYEDAKLMLFTGLHDKNGKEIYEGDVITYIDYDSSHEDEYLNKGVVEYYADEMKFTISNRNTVEIESIDFKKEVEVIGNVFENPELLSDKH